MQIFKLAAGINFIQGRRTKAVAAVCLYISCRLQQSENKFMLIDFSDVLTLNVFKLGQIYTALLKALHFTGNRQNIQLINPEDLILRFSKDLEFGESQMRVCTEAVRIVQRMNRDWMTTGRRPAGICGGALILAARMNNFRRTPREVSFVVKVAEATILKRLDEFKVTESSGLTVDEFRTVDLENACDPPAFYEQKNGKKKRGRKRKVVDVNDGELSDGDSERAASALPPNTGGQLLTPANTQAYNDARSMPPPPVPIDPALLEISAQRLSELASSPDHNSATRSLSLADGQVEPTTKRRRGRPPGRQKQPSPPAPSEFEQEAAIESEIQEFLSDPSNIAQASLLHSTHDGTSVSQSPPATQEAINQEATVQHDPSSQIPAPEAPAMPPPIEQLSTTLAVLNTIPSTPIIPDSEFASDPEVSNCLLSPAEILVKERIWVHENRDYLRAQSAKLLKQQLAEQNGTTRQIIRRKRRRARMGDLRGYGINSDDDGEAAGAEGGGGAGRRGSRPMTPAEATAMMMKKRGYSRKINYKAIEELYVPSPSRSASASASRRDSLAESPLSGTPSAAAAGSSAKMGTITSPDGTAMSPGGTTVEGEAAAAAADKDGAGAEDAESEEEDYVEDEGETLEDIVKELREEEEEEEEEYEGEEYD